MYAVLFKSTFLKDSSKLTSNKADCVEVKQYYYARLIKDNGIAFKKASYSFFVIRKYKE
jgi:hypothetical protein